MVARLIGLAAAMATVSPAAAQGQVDPALQGAINLMRETDYALIADRQCGLLSDEQRVAITFVRDFNRAQALQKIGANAMAQHSVTARAEQDWTPCPKRAAKPDAWKVIDHYRMMGDAMAAAASVAQIDPARCGTTPPAPKIDKNALARVSQTIGGRYSGTPAAAAFRDQRDRFASDIAINCAERNNAAMVAPAIAAASRTAGPVEGRDRKLFVALTGNVAAYGYRVPADSQEPLVIAKLRMADAPDETAQVQVSGNGAWKIDAPDRVARIALQANDGTTVYFTNGGPSRSKGRRLFLPDAAAAALVRGPTRGARLEMRYETEAKPGTWQDFLAATGSPASLHLEAVASALKWAAAYSLEEVQ